MFREGYIYILPRVDFIERDPTHQYIYKIGETESYPPHRSVNI